MDLAEAIRLADMGAIIDSLNAYANSRLKSVGIKDFNGKEPIDFVGELILKVIESERDWSKAQCTLKEFLFGCLKSEIYNFFKKKKIRFEEFPEIPAVEIGNGIEEKRSKVTELLKQEGADDDELTVFEYWMDGIFKSAEIAKDLGVDVKEIYNITKRLERNLNKIQSQAIDIV